MQQPNNVCMDSACDADTQLGTSTKIADTWWLSGPLVDSSTFSSSFRMLSFLQFVCERKCLLYDSHQQGKIMIMIMKTPGSLVDSPVAEGKEEEER